MGNQASVEERIAQVDEGRADLHNLFKAFAPLIPKDAEGKDARMRLEDAGGRYQPLPSVHANVNAEVGAEIARERKAADAESQRRAMPPILGFDESS